MIFVTVGTHEQPFNRLVKKIDELKGNGTIQDDVFIQTGFSTYEPKNCQWSKLISYNQMIKKVEDARIVITHEKVAPQVFDYAASDWKNSELIIHSQLCNQFLMSM